MMRCPFPHKSTRVPGYPYQPAGTHAWTRVRDTSDGLAGDRGTDLGSNVLILLFALPVLDL
eukprot:1811017-Rhodomonas_salina.1